MKIGVITGLLLECRLLYPVLKAIEESTRLKLRPLVSGMGIAPGFGVIWRVVEIIALPDFEIAEVQFSGASSPVFT